MSEVQNWKAGGTVFAKIPKTTGWPQGGKLGTIGKLCQGASHAVFAGRLRKDPFYNAFEGLVPSLRGAATMDS